jgi:hypothetical protein
MPRVASARAAAARAARPAGRPTLPVRAAAPNERPHQLIDDAKPKTNHKTNSAPGAPQRGVLPHLAIVCTLIHVKIHFIDSFPISDLRQKA